MSSSTKVETQARTSLSNIRPFEPGDIPKVSALFEKVLAHGAPVTESVLRYYEEVFFENPWRDENLPSLVYETRDKDLAGFMGIVPRRMVFGDRILKVAATNQFMVDPAWRSRLVGIQLLRHFFQGPQDLAIADNAGEEGRRVWEGCGGRCSVLRSIHWTRPLRPCEYVRQLVRKRKFMGPIAAFMLPGTRAADALATRMPQSPFCLRKPKLTLTEVSCKAMAVQLSRQQFLQKLRPDYDERAATWLLRMVAKYKCRGEFFCVLVHDEERNVVGWFQYDLCRDGLSEVVQLCADRGRFREVIDHLFYHAWERGAVALRGRIDPEYAQELSDAYCLFRRDGPWALIHSNQPDVLDAFYNNDAFFSRLEGEWWINFPQAEWD